MIQYNNYFSEPLKVELGCQLLAAELLEATQPQGDTFIREYFFTAIQIYLYVMEAVLADDETLAMNELGVNLVYSSDQFLLLLNTYNVLTFLTNGEITVSVMLLLAVSFAN